MEKIDTHKFLFTLNYNNEVEGKKIIFTDRENNEKQITLKRIEVGASPVSIKLYCKDDKRYLVPFIRIKKIFDKDDNLIWDNTDQDTSDARIIKGYK